MTTLRRLAVRMKRNSYFVLVFVFLSFVIGVFCYFSLNKRNEDNSSYGFESLKQNSVLTQPLHKPPSKSIKRALSEEISPKETENETIENSKRRNSKENLSKKLNNKVHVFYYAWYGSPEVDGKWWHWNHEYIPPWDPNDHKIYPTGAHKPPKDVGANFYPELGPYSSKDPLIVKKHMKMIADSNIGVLSLSWYPPGQADEHGPQSDRIVPALLEEALTFGLKICLHIEPYEGRNVTNLRKHLHYVLETYGSHPAYYKISRGSRSLPLFYIYDSYRITTSEWQRLLTVNGDLSVRNTMLDAMFIGLLVEYKHRFDIKKAGFDGFYTYFASNGFSYGSSWKNWKSLASYAFKNSLIFIPSVGPGYMDTRVRAWNGKNTQPRRNGVYYETAWRMALSSPAKLVSVTSFNEWHEGTQIEPAIPMKCGNYTYESYSPRDPRFYLDLTEKWSYHLANRTRV